MSIQDYERLGIGETRSTRNELLMNAVPTYLDRLTQAFENKCGSIAGQGETADTCWMESSAPVRRTA